MDSIDITDMAFSLAGITELNDVVPSVQQLGENIDESFNIYFIIGLCIFIGGIFLYNFFYNQKKSVTIQEANNEVYDYEKPI
jgi:hypothetical protein